MSHEVETMAYVGQTPWHGLGSELSPNRPLDVWRHEAGMDWEILETPVQYRNSRVPNGGHLDFPEHKVLFRSDNLRPLSVVSQRYKVVQPEQILEFYRDLTEISGFELETAGVLKGGRKLWALAKTGQSGTLKGDDTTNGYVLLATACDGTLATTAQFTSVRVVCNNTLAIATAGAEKAVKVPHSTVFEPEKVKRQLGISVSAWEEFMYRLKALSERKVSEKEAHAFYEQTFATTSPNAQFPVMERSMAKAKALYEGAGMGSQLSSSKGTAYGLLNSVTEFVDHGKRAKSQDHRLDSAWFGQGAKLKERALHQAMDLVA
ncbi:phage/plasmid-related protein TIGR03299 [gamma proteobacterium HTCC5015]|nr:phage/plasmid-related protein TIGR03299 [gamma proteobacterium HTCC5015]